MACYVTGDIHGNPNRLSSNSFYEQKDFNGNKDENGEDYSRFYLKTTEVKDWDFIYDGVIRVETLNTIYEFEKVERE